MAAADESALYVQMLHPSVQAAAVYVPGLLGAMFALFEYFKYMAMRAYIKWHHEGNASFVLAPISSFREIKASCTAYGMLSTSCMMTHSL